MEIKLAPGGHYTHNAVQQTWVGDSQDLQTAFFAGQEMMVMRESDNSSFFELHFMGLLATGFTSSGEAKSASPEFARAVFEMLKATVVDQ